MKFKKHIIVYSKAMNRNKTYCGLWNIENMVKLKIMILCMNSSFTNMTNVHTCTIAVWIYSPSWYLSRRESFSNSPVI
jgi:hypothetical protein